MMTDWMANISDMKVRARRQVHSAFAYDAIYKEPFGLPVECHVRKTDTSISDIGDLGGMSGVGNAGMMSVVSRLIHLTFLRSEVEPVRNAEVTLDGSKYRVVVIHPPYGETITVEADLMV